MRSVPEWIAKHDDQAIPRSVRARVWEKYEGKCYLSGTKIKAGDKWDLDHIKALCNGGEHRESNLAPVLNSEHKKKTVQDIDERTKVNRVKAKHFGMVKKVKARLSKKYNKETKQWQAYDNVKQAFI